jgi:hypothetical protein
VRQLEPEQAQRLVRQTQRSTDRVRCRTGIVLASGQGRSVVQIAEMFAASGSRSVASTRSI